MIDLDQMPPDWKFAQNHAKAQKPGKVNTQDTRNNKVFYCTCCLKPIIKSQVSLWSNSKQLEFLGFGFPLYFIFIKYCIILLLVLICSYSSVALYWAIENNHQFCTSSHRLLTTAQLKCTSFMIMFAHIATQVSQMEYILRASSFLLQLFTLIYIRDHIRKTKKYYSEKTTTYSNFTVAFKNLPLTDNIQQKITRFIDEHFAQEWQKFGLKFNGQEYVFQKKVHKITLVPHIKKFDDLIKQKDVLIEEKRQLIIQNQKQQQIKKKKSQHNIKQMTNDNHNSNQNLKNPIQTQDGQKYSDQFLNQINKKIFDKSEEIDKMSHQIYEMASRDVLHSQIAIVILNRETFKNTILRNVKSGKLTKQVFQRYFGEQCGQIIIHESPEPNQMIWENFDFPISKRLGRKIIGWILTFVFLAVTTVVFYYLQLIKTDNLLHAIQENDTANYSSAIFLVFLSLLVVVLFNKLVMSWILHYFVHIERHDNTFQEQFSFGLKYTLGLFFTTALMTLAVEAVTYHNFYSHEYGVIEQESIMFFISAFLIPIIWIINPWQLFCYAKRKFYLGRKCLTQAEANDIMCDYRYTMGKGYAQTLQSMWFTFLYSSIIPFGAFLTILGLGLYYWVDKYNLLRRSSLKSNISGKMAVRSLRLLDLTLLFRPLGDLMFDTQMRYEYHFVTIILIVIGTLYFILPMKLILNFFHEQKFKQKQKTFQQIKDNFFQTYQTLHPIFGMRSSTKMINQFRQRAHKQITLSRIQSLNINIENQIISHKEIHPEERQNYSVGHSLSLIATNHSIHLTEDKDKKIKKTIKLPITSHRLQNQDENQNNKIIQQDYQPQPVKKQLNEKKNVD